MPTKDKKKMKKSKKKSKQAVKKEEETSEDTKPLMIKEERSVKVEEPLEDANSLIKEEERTDDQDSTDGSEEDSPINCKAVSKRKKKLKEEPSEESTATKEEHDDDDDDDDDEDGDTDEEEEDLLAAAAAWAEQGNDSDSDAGPGDKPKQDTTVENPKAADSTEAKKWSLHVTQLSFDATEMDIRHHFVSKGCVITSLRLVYDYDRASRTKTFRGVAFWYDLLDRNRIPTAKM